MNPSQVILGLTKVAGTNRPKAFQPDDGSFEHPAPGWLGFLPGGAFSLADAANVRDAL